VAKEIDINSAEWLELVFENKNKNYGAFRMRNTSGKRHRNAMILVFLFVCFIAFLPTLIKTIALLRPKREAVIETRVIADLKLEDQVKEKNIIEQHDAPPPPPLKSTVQFTVPDITDEEIPEGEELLSQDDIAANKTQISVGTVIGTDESGVDIADIADHVLIVEETIMTSVEQMPQFPGGEDELQRYLVNNLKYPQIALEMGDNGRVVIRFAVSKTGKMYHTATFRPPCWPGIQLGMPLTTRTASLSQAGLNERATSTLPT